MLEKGEHQYEYPASATPQRSRDEKNRSGGLLELFPFLMVYFLPSPNPENLTFLFLMLVVTVCAPRTGEAIKKKATNVMVQMSDAILTSISQPNGNK